MISFNESFAAILQQVAVFLEAGGLLLVLIEMYLPQTARRMDGRIDGAISFRPWKTFSAPSEGAPLGAPLLVTAAASAVLTLAAFQRSAIIGFAVLLGVAAWVFFAIFVLMGHGFALSILSLGAHHEPMFGYDEDKASDLEAKAEQIASLGRTWFIIAAPLYISFAVYTFSIWILVQPLRLPLAMVDRVGKGHALGGLGVLLALLGLGCEGYQLIWLCLSDGCYQFLL